ncbi:winged helix-turn-helix transcriptional regulator [Actinocatenispora rupis]|uniref:HxlR family transcriptional regulator n=1 Tax=Actinocatenispora rupis TaxID=519421 RepID=A0A8J3NAW4_9ACTN|nr:helix-turn-helix domain-containing protein [Actinocatenispora rupis]GID10130.1 HxlR family transcriptional regulator [Actinocatenispora rupis]
MTDAAERVPRCADARSRERTRLILRRIGDKWSMLVMTRLMDGPRRFTAVLHSVDGISHRMLTHTLRTLEQDGLVSRTAYAEVPPRVEYALTPDGSWLLTVLTDLAAWVEERDESASS